jgi:soluble lytic murein transglycosylase-like protein
MSLIKVPLISVKYYDDSKTIAIRQKVDSIKAAFGKSIAEIAKLTKVSENILYGFIFIESAGNPIAYNKSSGATGLMQLVPAAASDIVVLENKQKRLTEPEKTILRKYLGSRLDCILSMKYMGHKLSCNNNVGVSITKEDLYQPELNVLIGAIYLGQLIDQFTENGLVRLDKVVLKYNRGLFARIIGTTVKEVYDNANTESRNYISKLAGENGVLHILPA